MAGSIKYIRSKIQATKNTSQITKAMNMVSASKLRRAENSIKYYYGYINKIEEIVSNLVSATEITHPLIETREIKKTLYIIITSDRGLAGPFNNNVYKVLDGIISKDDYVLSFGGRGYNYSKNKYNMISQEMYVIRDDVRFEDIIDPLLLIVKLYLRKEFDCVKVIYNHFQNTLNQETLVRQILPISVNKTSNKLIYDYDGGVESILDKLLPIYIENMIYGFILDSKASEHAARMTAMKSATDNADKIISDLELVYNRVRQASITLELTDIIGGASATNS